MQLDYDLLYGKCFMEPNGVKWSQTALCLIVLIKVIATVRKTAIERVESLQFCKCSQIDGGSVVCQGRGWECGKSDWRRFVRVWYGG